MPRRETYQKKKEHYRKYAKEGYWKRRDSRLFIHPRWIKDDENFLIEHFSKLSLREISTYLNRTLSSIQGKAGRLKLTKIKNLYYPDYKTISAELWIYLAGLFDGEGHISLRNKRAIMVSISSTDRQVINWLKKNFGGNYSLREHKENKNWQSLYTWYISLTRASREVLCYIEPYSIIRRDIIQKILKERREI